MSKAVAHGQGVTSHVQVLRIGCAAWSAPAEFEWLLAYYRARDREAARWQGVRDLLREPRWQMHWDSIQFLETQRAAALQDGRDLLEFRAATLFCRAIARGAEQVFAGLSEGVPPEGGTLEEWRQHANECTYCRRMSLRWQTVRTRRQPGLPVAEPLLADWLMARHYSRALETVTARLAETMPVEGFTDLVNEGMGNEAPSRFVAKMRFVAPLLLECVLPGDGRLRELTDRFLACVQRPEVIEQFRRVVHVRDEIGKVLARFLSDEGVCDPATVRETVPARVVENILWRLAAENCRRSVPGETEQAALKAAQESLRQRLQSGAPEPAERVAREAVATFSGVAPRVWEALRQEFERTSSTVGLLA